MEKLAKVMLLCGLLVSYVYVMEFFSAWWSESTYERHQFLYRMYGNWSFAFWIMMICNFKSFAICSSILRTLDW